MKVKHKALLVISLSACMLIFLTYFIFSFTYFGYINKQQQQEINRDFEVINILIDNEKDNLESTLMDWAYWDDTYQFIKDKNSKYIESNLMDNTLETLNLNMMTFLNSQGDLVYNKALQVEKDVLEELIDYILSNEEKDAPSGLLSVKDKVFIISRTNITDSNQEMQSNGYLIFVREVNEEILSYINKIAGVDVSFHRYNGKISGIDKISKAQKSQELIEVERLISDIDGKESIVMTVVKELSNYNIMHSYFTAFIIYFIILTAIIIIVMAVTANKIAFKRLYMLDDFMNTVATTKDTGLTLKMPGKDEFAKLADSINNMLGELNSAIKLMREKDNRFRLIMEATNDGYLDFFVKSREVYISPEWKSIIGYTEEDGQDLYGVYISKIHPECRGRLRNIYKEVVNGDAEYFAEEYRIIRGSGDVVWVQQRGKIAEKDENGKPIRIVSTLTNISDRKKYEEEILFLSYSDKLTGLRNRAYMDKQFETLDGDEKSKYFVIMGDLNGLKIVNDSWGHLEGDKLIRAVGDVLKSLCESEDIVSRWGGDEFVILIQDKDEEHVSDLIDRIKEAVGQISEFHFKVSIALGYAEKDENNLSSESVMSLAEKRMYRNKLMEDNSARNATISSLLRTLHEKHSETEEHTMRIKNLSFKLGKRLDLPGNKLDELALLSLLHDIGKIGIPEQILMKPYKLTSEEWEVMKGHSEIGYRIAKSTPELSHIAYEILCHHERYDGKGYPNGLRGEDIPILARIINVVDSFDVMTHKREYKAEMDKGYAFEELKRCSGGQFDPFIVDEFIRLMEEEDESMEKGA